MKSSKENALHKIFSFVLIAVLLVFIVGFAANGWQEDLNDSPNGDGGIGADDTDGNTNTPSGGDNTDAAQKPDSENSGSNDTQAPNNGGSTQKYINKMTGLEVSKEQSQKLPIGFVIDPALPLYGVSSSDIAIEFPTEDGTTRMLSYTTDDSLLWKIGSLVETRAFISSMSHFFGGIVVSYGNDDIVKYSVWDISRAQLDLKKFSSYHYVENTLYVYTSGEKVDAAITESKNIEQTAYKNAPYRFLEKDDEKGTSSALSVIIPYSVGNESALYYSESTGRYLYHKGGERKMDMLSGKNVSFKNVFILFANTTTYDLAIGTELVVDTSSGGRGYYITNGTRSEITWRLNENGELKFYSPSGDILSVNPGNSYYGYYKASSSSSVKFG